MEEKDKIGEDRKDQPLDPKDQDLAPKEPVDDDIAKKEEQLANLDRAIDLANEELRDIRDAKKKARDEDDEDRPAPKDPAPKKDEDDEVEVDLKSPSGKAWDKHIRKNVDPVQRELDQEKREVFNFTLRKFLEDYPNVARDEKKLKTLVQTYERIKNNSGRTQEGVFMDLRRAYGAEFLDEAMETRQASRFDDVRRRAIDSDAGVSRSTGTYREQREPNAQYSESDRAILAKWGLTPTAHQKMVKELEQKEQ